MLAPAINDEKVKRRRSFKDPVRIRLSIKRQTLGVKNAIDLVHNLNNKLKLKTNYVTNPEPKNNVNDEGLFTPKTRKAVDLEMIIENKCNELIIDIENYHLLRIKGMIIIHFLLMQVMKAIISILMIIDSIILAIGL